jgi:phosphoribosylaminoimidazole (AIR) synthetase
MARSLETHPLYVAAFEHYSPGVAAASDDALCALVRGEIAETRKTVLQALHDLAVLELRARGHALPVLSALMAGAARG